MKCKTLWMCLNCNSNQTNEYVQSILRNIRIHAHRTEPNIEQIELFIAKYTNILHPNHYILVEMKQKLAAIIRHMIKTAMDNFINVSVRDNSNFRTLLEKLLKRKIELCKELVPLLNILEPGISRLKAIAMYEQFTPLAQIAKIYYQLRYINDEKYLVDSSIDSNNSVFCMCFLLIIFCRNIYAKVNWSPKNPSACCYMNQSPIQKECLPSKQ